MRNKIIATLLAVVLSFALLTGCTSLSELIYKPKEIAQPQESSAEETVVSVSSNRGRNSLSEAMRKDYDSLLAAMVSHKPQVTLARGMTSEDITALIGLVKLDCPLLFGLSPQYTYSETKDGVLVELSYSATAQAYKAMLEKARASGDSLLAEMDESLSAYQKLLYIHDKLAAHITYDDKTENNDNIYGAFIDKKTACEGYAKAFQYLALSKGFDVTIVYGNAGEDSIGHAWNIVWVEGNPYHVDVTWDDTGFDEKTDFISHDYFLATDERIEGTHSVLSSANPVAVPVCTKTDLYYFNQEGILAKGASLQACKQAAENACKKAKRDGQNVIQFAFSDSKSASYVIQSTYIDGSLDTAVNEIAKRYGLKFSNKSYNKSTFVLTYMV